MDIRRMVVSVLAVAALGTLSAFAQTDAPADSRASQGTSSSTEVSGTADGTSPTSQSSSGTSNAPDDNSGSPSDPAARVPASATPGSDTTPTNEAGNQQDSSATSDEGSSR
jgi:hypothetical protein